MLKAFPVVLERPPPKALPVGPGDRENIVARKGLAAPAAPVAWGRKPTPTVEPTPSPCPALNPGPLPRPVGCEFSNELAPKEAEGLCLDASILGVVGADWGIGGRDSSRAAPNDEDGLNALRPTKPVVWGCRGEIGDDEVVAPVG